MNLEQKRIRVAKITIALFLAVFLVLSILRVVSAQETPLHSWDLLSQKPVDQPGNHNEVRTDPLGISSEELLFEQSSDDGLVVWYSAAGNRAHGQILVDKAMCEQGWTVYSGENQALGSYFRYEPASRSLEYVIVLYYEQAEGCEIIIEVV